MGLAASQARLLSITSRMADNELRSQLINNAKMRLTADSTRVSDEYIDALNKSQMMFQNFDSKGNEVYQDLTFNSLTAYSSYNTQYGIVDNAGDLLVSAKDGANFEAANGNLEAFLLRNGLIKTTDYFETLKTSQEFNDVLAEPASVAGLNKGVGYYDSFNVWQPLTDDIAELQAMYEAEIGPSGINHYGRDNIENSVEYGDYLSLVQDYSNARSKYRDTIKQRMRAFLAGNSEINGVKFRQTFSHGGKVYPDKDFEWLYNNAIKYCNGELDELGNRTGYLVDDVMGLDEFKEDFLKFANLAGLSGSGPLTATGDMIQKAPDSDAFVDILNENLNLLNKAEAGVTSYNEYFIEDYAPIAYFEVDDAGNPIGAPIVAQRYNLETTPQWEGQDAWYFKDAGQDLYTKRDPNGTYYWFEDALPEKRIPASWDGSQWVPGSADNATTGPLICYEEIHLTQEVINDALRYLYTAFRDSIISNLDEQYFIENDEEIQRARNFYLCTAENLAKFIYGEANGTTVANQLFNESEYVNVKMMDYLDDPTWVLSNNTSVKDTDGDGEPDVLTKSHWNPFSAMYPTTTVMGNNLPEELNMNEYAIVPLHDDPTNETKITGYELKATGTYSYTVNYQTVKDMFILDSMMEHYGEPTYTWIDQENKNEDGTAKAEWYTNLFNRMQDGYKRLEPGLGVNQEWLQFAFESGLVHMVQVNHRDEWEDVLYSNCSNITNSQADVDITIAEAKYNREMAKIQAKDRQYDIELKNIDTEHESVKQEYESIKGVIGKNIERNYKILIQG